MLNEIELLICNPILRAFGLPRYATAGAAGLDLVACLDQAVVIAPGQQALIGTGMAIALPDAGWVGVVAGRSGLALRHGLRIAQGIGVIDSDYRGEIKVILHNGGSAAYTVEPGERIAQLLILPVRQVTLKEVTAFSGDSERGAAGFGHTGRH